MIRTEGEIKSLQETMQARWREIRDLPQSPDIVLERIKLAARLEIIYWILGGHDATRIHHEGN